MAFFLMVSVALVHQEAEVTEQEPKLGERGASSKIFSLYTFLSQPRFLKCPLSSERIHSDVFSLGWVLL